jgi:[acyl-carrier-protein] S-malonyltransferase
MPKVAAGHSLGEVSAFLCAGGFSVKDALRFIKFRATFMIESKGDTKTKMSAVLGLDGDSIKKILSDKKAKFLEAVNMNSPLQTVIAGNADEVEAVKNDLAENGAKRVIDLTVSVPSHSSLMNIASTKLKLVLDELHLSKPNFPVIQNLHAKIPLTTKEICNNLAEQISNPVQWVSSMNRLKKYGLEEHIEIGPNKVLSGLAKQNRIKGTFSSLDNIDTFKGLLEKYGK